jgi:hypothetical protein
VPDNICEIFKNNEEYIVSTFQNNILQCKVLKFLNSNTKKPTLTMMENLIHWLEYEIINFHTNNFMETEIILLYLLVQLSRVIKPKLIILLYTIYSFNFIFKSEFCPNSHGRKYSFPNLNGFDMFIYLFIIEDNKFHYLFNPNEAFKLKYANKINFLSFEEINNDELVYSKCFMDFFEICLLAPLLSAKKLNSREYRRCIDASGVYVDSFYNEAVYYKHSFFKLIYKIGNV